MRKNNFVILLLLAVVLGGVCFLLLSEKRSPSSVADAKILDNVRIDDIAKIKIEQGPEQVELELKDGKWQVLAKAGYQADTAKTKALVLRIFDLSAAQEISSATELYDQLGLSEEAVKRGFSRVTFFKSDGSILSSLFLGEARKSKDKSPMALLSGQYVRRVEGDKVYLVSGNVSVTAKANAWLEAALLNLLQSSVFKMKQERLLPEKETLFELTAKPSAKNLAEAFTLEGGVPESKVLQTAVLNQVLSGLENLRIDDVFRSDELAVKDLQYDLQSSFLSKNGLVYTASTAEKDGKIFARFSVSFDEALAKDLEPFYENIRAAIKSEREAKKAAEEKAKEEKAKSEAQTTKSEEVKSANDTPAAEKQNTEKEEPLPELKLASVEEATKQNQSFNGWVFELVNFQGRKLRNTRKELLEPPPPPPSTQPAAQKPGNPLAGAE